jgi:multiple sugar transport system substrate-binding protein
MNENLLSSQVSRRGLLALGGVAAGAALAACGGGKSAQDAAGGANASASSTFSGTYDGPAVTLAYWNGFTGGDGPFMKKMVADFMKENPKITVTNNTVEWAQYYQRVPAAVTAGKGPDVGVMHMDQLSTNAARKIIIPLDDLAKSLGLTEADFTPDVWKAGIYQDKRYGIPLDVHSLAMYWNTGQAKQAGVSDAPTDENSFMAALDKLQGAVKLPFWMPSRWPAHLMFYSLLWQNGGQLYSEDGTKALYDSEEGVAALQWMVDIVTKGYSPRNVAQDSQYVGFKNNKTAVTWDGIWQINDLKAAQMAFGIAPIPKIFGTEAVWANSHNFYISRQAQQDDNKLSAAKVFIDWMSKHSGEWAGAGMIPARKSVRESSDVTSSTQAPIAEKIDTMHFLPAIPGVADISGQTIEIAVADAVLGKQSPKDALATSAKKATAQMEANKKKYGS